MLEQSNGLVWVVLKVLGFGAVLFIRVECPFCHVGIAEEDRVEGQNILVINKY